jgi:LmbE family N-acetylglucosaminyl deacetylase
MTGPTLLAVFAHPDDESFRCGGAFALLARRGMPRSVANTLGLSRLHAVPDKQDTLTVDVNPVWEQKITAIRCHRTQAGASPILAASEGKQRQFLGKEHFRLAAARAGQDFSGATDLFLERNSG